MENYYFLLDLDKNMSIAEIKSAIEKQKKKYIKMLNSPKIEKQAEAQNKLLLLESADKVFSDENTKNQYDQEVANSKTGTEPNYNSSEKHQYHHTSEGENDYIIYYNQAVEAINRTDGASALAAATKAFNLMPNDKDSNYLMAHAHYTFGNIADAVQYLNTTLTIDPTFDAAYCDLGEILITHYSDIEQGKLKLEQCLKINPGNEKALLFLGSLYNEYNDLTSAKQYLEQLVQYHPNNHSYQTRLKEVKDKENRKNSAILENAADNIMKKGYINDEDEYKQYMKFLNSSKIFHPTPNIEEKIFQGRKKQDLIVDFRILSYFFLLSIPMQIFTFRNQGLGLFLSIIIGICASYILYNAVVPKWKLEKRRKTKIRDWWQIGLIYFFAFAGTLFFILLLLINFQVAIIMGIMYAVFKYGLPNFNKKKDEETDED